jgi:molybdenum cofactor cytidylyltransferase
MGRTKVLCDFDGLTALELAISSCRGAGLGKPIVVLGHARDEITAKVPLDDVDVAINENYKLGQTSSIKRGIAALPSAAEAFVIYPVDYPCIAAGDIELVLKSYRKLREIGKRIFIPSYALKRGHPVLIDAELKPDFEALRDDVPVRTLINRQAAKICHVDMPHGYVLMDMDTPEDYDKCLEGYRSRRRG